MHAQSCSVHFLLSLYNQECPGGGAVSATVGGSSHYSRQCPADVPTGHPALDTETASQVILGYQVDKNNPHGACDDGSVVESTCGY